MVVILESNAKLNSKLILMLKLKFELSFENFSSEFEMAIAQNG